MSLPAISCWILLVTWHSLAVPSRVESLLHAPDTPSTTSLLAKCAEKFVNTKFRHLTTIQTIHR
ncbi:hypothetical protein EVA_10481 [gut metagenome]|uniref:Uncharacterized protein n=1 Tax=gut metagenome TaxID=749906 RepID=J9CMR8_9ZZZZ